MSVFFHRIIEYVSEDSSHFVWTVSPILLETGEVESSFSMRVAQNCEETQYRFGNFC
jgi:hypothetical protein